MRKEVGLALLALGLGDVMLALDLTALNVALPAIERDLAVDLSTGQWIVNAYLLVYGMMIVTGGRLADELGRRRVILAGGALFAVATLMGGLAPNVAWLIAARVLMGAGAGLMLPSLLGMAYVVAPPAQATLAGGLTTGAYALGMVIGPIVGGALTEFLSWRWIQFINLPIAALVMFGIWRTIPNEPGDKQAGIDYAGIVTLSAALVALLFALDQASSWGWLDGRIHLSLVLSTALFVLFLWLERRAGDAALIPADIVRKPGVSLICALRALIAPAYSAMILFAPQLLQKVLGWTPTQAGLGMLPMLGTYAVVSFLIGTLGKRFDPRLLIVAGTAAMGLGPAIVSLFNVSTGYLILAAGLLVMGLGLGLFMPSSSTAAVQADDRGRKGLISGLILMFQFVGGAIGLGLTTTIVASSERAAVDLQLASTGAVLTASERGALGALLAGAETATQILRQFPPADAAQLLETARAAFADGVSTGLRVDAGLVGIGVILAVIGFTRVRAVRGEAPAG